MSAVLFVAIAVAAYVLIGRHLSTVDKPRCVHQRVKVMDGWVDQCRRGKDPFAGSGTTIEAAMLEGFRCIAIEREREYIPLIMARIARVAA